MRTISRRSVVASIGALLPLGAGRRTVAAPPPAPLTSTLHFQPFEEALRAAFATAPSGTGAGSDGPNVWRRVEIGDSDLVRGGLQGRHNDRPFAGFPAGRLRIIRTGSTPGPLRSGVRLYVTTVDVFLVGDDVRPETPSRPLDFGSLPPAPTFA